MNYLRKLDNMIPKTVVEDLKKDKNSLLRKLQVTDLHCNLNETLDVV